MASLSARFPKDISRTGSAWYFGADILRMHFDRLLLSTAISVRTVNEQH